MTSPPQVSYPQQSGWPGYGFDDPAIIDPSFPLTVTPGAGSLVLTWPAVVGTTGYDVYCGANNVGLVKVGRLVNALTFTVANLVPGATYYCQVFARFPAPATAENTSAMAPGSGGISIGVPNATTPGSPITWASAGSWTLSDGNLTATFTP